MDSTAEFRGPSFRDPASGFRDPYRDSYDEGANEDDMDIDRTRGFSVRSGRIILLGDGTEVITEQNEDNMFDHGDEEQEEEEEEEEGEEYEDQEHEHEHTTRNEREDTPAPPNDIQTSETSPITKPEELTSHTKENGEDS